MRLSIAQAIGLVSDTAFAGRPAPAGFCPSIDPRLRVAYVPRLHQPPPKVGDVPVGRFHGHSWCPGFPAPDPGAPGLVDWPQFNPRDCPPRRNGLNGLTDQGRKRLTAGCCLLEERRRLLSFWTITLPDAVMATLRELDAWASFQGWVRQLLTRTLAEKGVTPLVLAVAELHPSRSLAAGQALPHLHVLFQGKRAAGDDWLLSPSDLDALIIRALARVGVTVAELPAAGNVQPIRKSVRRYLSKYVSKGPRQSVAGSDLAMLGDPRLCPRQWWFMSKPLLALILESTRFLPAHFLAWLIDRAKPSWQGAPYVVQRVDIADPRAPSVWVVTFRSPWALFASWEAYERAVILGESDLPPRHSHGFARPEHDPQQHQQLRTAPDLGRPGHPVQRQWADDLCD